MKNFLLFFLVILFSCAENQELKKPLEVEVLDLQKSNLDHVWICHHPGSEYHNEICVDNTYPDGCFIPGDRSKFCWILNKDDCSGKLLEEWQINCRHLKGN